MPDGTSIGHSAKSKGYLIRKVGFYSMLYALCTLLLFLTPSFSIAGKQSETENTRTQIKQIEIDLKREKEKLEKYDVKEKDILEQLSQIEEEIDEKRKILKEIENNLDIKKEELKRHRDKQEDLEKNLNRVETLLVERLVAFYKNAKRGYIRVLLSTEDMDLLNHNLKYLRVIMDRDRAVMDELARQKADYHREMSIIQEQLDAVTRLEESETKNLGELKDILEKEVLLLAKIHREKEFYEVAVKELQSAADDLKDTITNLESSAKKGDVPLPAGFGKSKGKLPMPLKGKIIKNAKKKGKSSSGKQKGIYIDGPSGMEVKAVYQGRVEYSGVLKGYGQVVVINHGERYYTISAYLDGRKKYEGDTVLAGDVIGYVGEAGLTTGPALYFEIRKGDEDLNPVKWIKVN